MLADDERRGSFLKGRGQEELLEELSLIVERSQRKVHASVFAFQIIRSQKKRVSL